MKTIKDTTKYFGNTVDVQEEQIINMIFMKHNIAVQTHLIHTGVFQKCVGYIGGWEIFLNEYKEMKERLKKKQFANK